MNKLACIQSLITITVLVLGIPSYAQVALTSRTTGNWDDPDTWLSSNLTGTIATSSSSDVVTGSGTSFTAELSTGVKLYRADGTTLIGVVLSISSNTSLSLTSNAANNNSNISYRVRKVPGSGDQALIRGANGLSVIIPSDCSAECASVELGDHQNTKNNALTLNSGSSLTVFGDFNHHRPTSGGMNELDIGPASLTVGGTYSFVGLATNNNRFAKIIITSGSLTIEGDLVLPAISSVTDLRTNEIDMSGGNGTLNLGGAFSIGGTNAARLVAGTSSTFNYNGSNPQTVVIGTVNFDYANLSVNNTDAGGATLNAAITPSNVTGDLKVLGGVLHNGGFEITGNPGKSFDIASGAEFKMGGSSSMPTGFGTLAVDTGSTVVYHGANQPIRGMAYGRLRVRGNGTKTLDGPITVEGDLTIESGTSLDVSASNYGMTLKGNWINDGDFNARNGTVTMNGNSAQTMNSATFHDLTIDNFAGVDLVADQTVNGTLTVSAGNLNTGGYRVILGASGTVNGETTNRYVRGILETSRSVGTEASSFGNIGVALSVGSNDLGTVTITRSAGPGAAATFGAVSGINRQWNFSITGSQPSNGRQLTLDWLSDDDNGKDATLARVYHSTDDGTSWTEVGSTQDAVIDATDRSITVTINSFSDYTVADDNSPLPVELVSFSASAHIDGVLLSWTTATETNNYGFEVERSLNGRDWENIGFVQGHGSVSVPRNYSFIDRNGLQATNTLFYRLTQRDRDGSTKQSPVIEFNHSAFPSDPRLSEFFPNPVHSTASAKYSLPEATHASLKIHDALGRLVLTILPTRGEAGVHVTSFDASSLAPGIYFATLRTSTGAATPRIFVKR